jgi:hypothetical protein
MPDREEGPMTTDLTGDFELGEEEFDWDVFLPDPDEAELAAEAAALEDEGDLAVDDSDLDWEAALHDDPQPDGDERAGAAFERIVDTVRRSFEEPESELPPSLVSLPEPERPAAEAADLGDDVELDLGPEFESDLDLGAEFEWELGLGAEFTAEPEHAAVREHAAEWAAELDLGAEFAVELDPAAERALEVTREPGADSAADTQAEERVPAERIGEDRPSPAPGPELGSPPEPVSAREPDVVLVEDPPPEPDTRWESEREPDEHQPVRAQTDAEEGGPHKIFLPSAATAEFADDAARQWSPTHVRTRTHQDRRGRSRVFTATFVLACLVLVALVAALAIRSFHHGAPAANPPAPNASRAAAAPDTARIEAATGAVDSATAEARAGIAAMTSFPTPASVATIINPYISSLQLYETVLSGTKVPPSSTAAVARAGAQARQDLTFLDTIHGLPPVQLGAYLGEVGTETAQLESTLNGLQQSLRPPTA